jgi:hypothetical protein
VRVVVRVQDPSTRGTRNGGQVRPLSEKYKRHPGLRLAEYQGTAEGGEWFDSRTARDPQRASAHGLGRQNLPRSVPK